MRKISVTQERINALRIIQNKSFEDMANALKVPVYVVKVWCGQKLTISERFKFLAKRLLGGGQLMNGAMEAN